ncbi:MAG TPA: hypothetical protein VN606_00010 [Thermoleophilaceae bacterium]|nr:hypothetical protein [Thermoleophilaceae bacterium]
MATYAARRRLTGASVRARALAAPLGLAAIVGAAFAWSVSYSSGIHEFFVMSDELGYLKQSISIWHLGRPLRFSDYYFTSYGQLLPILSAPLFGTATMAHAYQASHYLYAFFFASTAVPAYLLAREVRCDQLSALLVAALTVAVPWLTVSATVMSEVVAYPAFVWAVLAMQRALAAPSPWRDALALGGIALAFLARTQFVFLGLVLLLAVLVQERSLRAALMRHKLLWGAAAAAGIGLLIVHSSVRVLGAYYVAGQGSLFPSGWFRSGREQLSEVMLAIGFVPATLTFAWVAATVGRPRDAARHAFALLVAGIVPAMIYVTGSFAVRFVSGPTDRYFFYAVPLLAVGTAMWFLDRRAGLVLTAVAGGVVAWLAATVDLVPTLTMVNPSFNVHIVWINRSKSLGVSPHLVFAIGATLALAGAVALRRRLPARTALLAAGVPLLVFSSLVTGNSLHKLEKATAAEDPNFPASQAWVDRAAHGGRAAIYVGLLGDPKTSTAIWWDTNFWNKTIERAVVQEQSGDLGQRYVKYANPDLARGTFPALDGYGYLAMSGGETRLRPRGPVVGSLGPMQLFRLEPGAPLVWATSGVLDGGELDITKGAPTLRVYGPGRNVTLAFQAAPTSRCPCTVRPGGGLPPLRIPATGPATVKGTVRAPTELQLTPVRKEGGWAPQVRLVGVQVS